jgi:hypothetical protein
MQMEILIDYWQITLVGILIIIGAFYFNLAGQANSSMEFKPKGMPYMMPISIETKLKGFWGGIWLWLMTSRTWEITKDFHFSINGKAYIIPKGFTFDGASVPKFLRSWLSPMGVLLIGGLVHDYMYKYEVLLKKGKKVAHMIHGRSEADQIFRDINIEVNGFRFINYLAYYALVLGGFAAWNGHRKNGKDWKETVI